MKKLPPTWAKQTKEVATLQLKGAAAFDAVSNRTDRFKVDPRFRWITMDRRVMKPEEMATPHLWNALRMIWNHTIPVPYRLMPYKPYNGIQNWTKKTRKWAIANLYNELMNRNNRSKSTDAGLFKMANHIITATNEQLKLL